MSFWQVGSGDLGRDYSQLFLDHDVMCIGPGKYGKFVPKTYDAVVKRGEFAKIKIATIRRFHDDVQIEDVVLLRKGHLVVGLGVVAGHPFRWDYRRAPATLHVPRLGARGPVWLVPCDRGRGRVGGLPSGR